MSRVSQHDRPADLTIDEVLAKVGDEQLPALLLAVAARLVTVNRNGYQAETGDRLLRAKETALRLGVSVDWLYDHWKQLPFAVRLPATNDGTGKAKKDPPIRFSERGLEEWIRRQRSKR
jgi:hypothetical protein